MNVLALAFALAAAELPPPPPLLDAPTEDEATPDEAPPVEEAPPVLRPAPRIPREERVPRAQADEGFDGFAVGALQFLVPCGTAVVAVPCGLLIGAVFYPALICVVCAMPAVNGYLATYVGDRFGKGRAPAIWPVLASYAGLIVAGVAGAGLLFVTLSQQLDGQTAVYAALGSTVVLGAGSSLLLPVAYALNAEPKHLGDDGTEAPGWFEPGHPATKTKRSTREPPDAPPALTTMRF